MQHNIVISYATVNGGQSVTGRIATDGDSEINIDYPWAVAPTGKDMEQTFIEANMKSCVLYSTVDATLVTKATGGVVVKTITLLAGVPQIALNNNDCDNLLGTTAVSMHLTSAAASGNFKALMLFDSAA